MKALLSAIISLLLFLCGTAQPSDAGMPLWQATIETCNCRFATDSSFMASAPAAFQSTPAFRLTTDSSFKTQCGYLIVPENRKKAGSRMIKLPFIVLKSNNPNKKKDPVLFTSGGPGNSSLGWINGMSKSSVIKDRDCIAFEQRGTRFAIPYLRTLVLDSIMKVAYRENLPKDSMWIQGVKLYKQRLLEKGIDIEGYDTDETVSDITDLLTLLHIDSVNLMGVSYSGGLMTAVLQRNPKKVRSLVLDSPLPLFAAIDEDEPKHFIEALHLLCKYVTKDSVHDNRYADLEERFHRYFNKIKDSSFYISCYDSLTRKTIPVAYDKNELLSVIVNSMLDRQQLKRVPFIINEIVSGRHQPFLQPKLERILNSYPSPDGMRMLVYCADQAAFSSPDIIKQLYGLYPYLEGYRINDVWKAVCDCWDVPPVKTATKQPFYTNTPVLLCDGEMDPACSPLYLLRMKHYMPNAQPFVFKGMSHVVGGPDFYRMTQEFLDNPLVRVVPGGSHIVSYGVDVP